LHRELKTSKNRNNKQKEVQYDQYDKKNIKKCIDDFKEESSIISKLFFGFKETTEECLNCVYENSGDNILCYNYEMFNCLVFPLDEIKNEINSNNVTIFDCFQFIQKTQLFTGDKRNYCNKCEQVYDSNFTTKIYEFPEVLILVFVRNKESGNSVKLDFEEKLNSLVLKKEAEIKTVVVLDKHIYDLCGVISYKEGIFIDYIASCKSPVDKKWYRYTSSEVTPIDDVQNGIINYETPYVLFYKKGKGK
jgi:ubiquitin C-terminal hydrolase